LKKGLFSGGSSRFNSVLWTHLNRRHQALSSVFHQVTAEHKALHNLWGGKQNGQPRRSGFSVLLGGTLKGIVRAVAETRAFSTHRYPLDDGGDET
jgi:hypothetical protein